MENATKPILFLLVDPPSFVRKLENLSSLVGSEVSLQCVLKGSEPMTVSWMKDNHELKEAEHIQITYENNTALLLITDVQRKHAGKYSCQAQNQAGSQSCSALLTVKGWFSHSSKISVGDQRVRGGGLKLPVPPHHSKTVCVWKLRTSEGCQSSS